MVKIADPHKWKGNRREQGEDFFQTPIHAVKPILSYIPPGVKTIWECTSGLNAITDVLRDAGYNVITTDINPRLDSISKLDFLHDAPDFEFDAIIFNPPFSFKTEFLQKVLTYDKWFCFICPITILETKTRSKLFEEYNLSIINLSNRVSYLGKYGKKPFFHSVWVMNDNKSRIYYEEVKL